MTMSIESMDFINLYLHANNPSNVNVSSMKYNEDLVISENCCNFIVLKYKDLQTIIAMITEDKVTKYRWNNRRKSAD